MGSINANPHETHFINTSVSSSETVSGLVAAEPAGVSWRTTTYRMKKLTENTKMRFSLVEKKQFASKLH